MSDYRRNRVPGGTYFFTVNLLDRRSHLLVEHIEELREAVRTIHAKYPFHIDGWVVLPDHMHCIWTLLKVMTISHRVGRRSKALLPNASQNRNAISCKNYQRRARHMATPLLGTRRTKWITRGIWIICISIW